MTRLLTVVILLGIAGGCQNSGSFIVSGAPEVISPAAMPTIPDLATMPRSASVPTLELTLGSNFQWRSDNTMIAGSVMALMGGVTEPSWVIYELETSDRPVISVGVESGANEGEFYLGLANFTNQTWEYRTPGTGPDTYMLEVTPENVHHSGKLYVVVVAPAGIDASVAQVELTVDEPGWLIYTLDDRAGAGAGVDLFVQDGLPMLAYVTHTLGGVNFYRSTVAFPTSPEQWVSMVVASGPNPEDITQPLEATSIDGRPAVVYTEGTEEIVRYAYSAVAEPTQTADWTAMDIYDCFNVSKQVGLIDLEGKPCIAFGSQTYNNHFAQAASSSPGEGDWNITRFDEFEDSASWASMAMAGGRPVIVCNGSFGDSSGGYYLRATSTTPAGPADWTAELMYGFGTAGGGSRVAERVVKPDSYRPVAAYLNDYFIGGLVLSSGRVEVPTATSEWRHVNIDSIVSHHELCLSDGRPFLLYYNQDDQQIKAAWATVATPESFLDFQFAVVEDGIGAGSLSCISIQNTPIIAYRDPDTDCLKFGFYDE